MAATNSEALSREAHPEQNANRADADLRQLALLENWADSIAQPEIAATLENTASVQDPILRSKVRAALLGSWCRRDMPGALKWFAQRGGEDPLHEQARDILAESMADHDPAAMFNWMRTTLPQTAQSELYVAFFRHWAKKSPAAAAAQLQLMADYSGSKAEWNDLLGPVVAQWAEANLTQALGWVQALPDGPGKSSALRQMSDAWTKADPRGAAAYALQQKDVELLKRISGKWAENDPQSAASWAANLPPGSEQNAAVARVAAIWAEKDPKAAAEYAASLPQGRGQIDAALNIVSMWAQTAPDDTAQWVLRFPEGATRDQAVGALVQAWTLTSPSDAGQWLENLPDGKSRDSAIAAFTSATDVASPSKAFRLALTMSDPALRNQQAMAVASAWLQIDPANARKVIAQSTLSSELKDSLGSSTSSQ